MSYNLFVGDLPKPLPKSDIYEYFKRYRMGDYDARDKIIQHNLRLVISQVNKFQNLPYEDEDLFSTGIIGLIKSVDTFDLTKNFEFSTYAARCINNEIRMFMRKGKKYINDSSIYQEIRTTKEVKGLILEDILSDSTIDFVSDYEDSETYKLVREIVKQLPDRQKEIVMLYFGFIDDEIYTQKEIANKLNITQSYVSKILIKTLEKIRIQLNKKEIIKSTCKVESKKYFCKKKAR